MTEARIHHTRSVELADFVAQLLFRYLAQRNCPTSVLLSGTVEMVPVFREIQRHARLPENKPLLPHLHLFEAMAAESGRGRRNVPWRFIQANLAGPAVRDKILTPEQIHPFSFSSDRAKDRELYLGTLRTYGEKPGMAILSIGGGTLAEGEEDPGHLAGILPGDQAIWQTTEAFAEVSGFKDPPKKRITMTPALIRETGFTVGVLRGKERQGTFFRYRKSDLNEVLAPSKLLNCSTTNFFCTDVLMD